MPCEAYQTSDPEPEEINFADMLLSVETSVTNLEIATPTEILFTEGSYVLVQPTEDSTSDIIIAQILSDVTD